ncbi:unnamed protein product [Trichobilharzia szidati]|nr:unnamed protein product [Trichobilharzia szidati]
MSEVLPGIEDLTKLKLSDLKKICKENKLPSTGTKTELISRISEVQGNKFVILQPGDEAELLGDSNDGDSTDVSSITQTTTADLTSSKSPTDDLDFAMTSPPSSTTTTTATKISSKKRRASDDLNPEDILSVEKKIAIEPVSSATTATVASIGVDHPTAECKDTTTAGLSDAERLALRAKRFGGSTSNGTSILSDSKLIERAKRFGLPINSSSIGGDSLEVDELGKLKQRAERFGQTTSKTLEKLTELERKAKRLEKFGDVTTTVSKKTPIDDELAKTIRAQKFGLVSAPSSSSAAAASTGSSLSEAERLAKRQMRFGLVDSKT